MTERIINLQALLVKSNLSISPPHWMGLRAGLAPGIPRLARLNAVRRDCLLMGPVLT
jgi:hypothetical protein